MMGPRIPDIDESRVSSKMELGIENCVVSGHMKMVGHGGTALEHREYLKCSAVDGSPWEPLSEEM
jgi:hypothetical protein